jgi:hypothetical protein
MKMGPACADPIERCGARDAFLGRGLRTDPIDVDLDSRTTFVSLGTKRRTRICDSVVFGRANAAGANAAPNEINFGACGAAS